MDQEPKASIMADFLRLPLVCGGLVYLLLLPYGRKNSSRRNSSRGHNCRAQGCRSKGRGLRCRGSNSREDQSLMAPGTALDIEAHGCGEREQGRRPHGASPRAALAKPSGPGPPPAGGQGGRIKLSIGL